MYGFFLSLVGPENSIYIEQIICLLHSVFSGIEDRKVESNLEVVSVPELHFDTLIYHFFYKLNIYSNIIIFLRKIL